MKTFSDGSFLEYGQGNFDSHCVFLTRPQKSRYAPKDSEYFQFIVDLAERFGVDRVYGDFVLIYESTKNFAEDLVLQKIEEISAAYEELSLDVCIWFTVLYMAMIAEELKFKAILKKRIKRLGVHQMLFDGFTPGQAAEFSKGRGWRELDEICKQRGF
ncbi:MAG: hypothetical protein FWE38_02420 [Firmicutes bacterium]|nr:hypothetical protein [Bacillota bacterium]